MSSPRIELPDSFDTYLAGLSAKRRRSVRLSLRPIERGEMTFCTISDPDELRNAIERLLVLKSEWWEKRERKMNPEHGSARFLAFTSEVAMSMVPCGLAQVWEVHHHDEVVAVTINLLDNASSYGWLFGVDFRHEEMSLGNALIAHGIRWSIETGRRYFDFMLGDEAYKYGYAPVDRGVLSATVSNGRARSRAAVGLSRLRYTVLPGTRISIFGRGA
jgi:CelD/BcsL family acetyltransferase involved in cellulose biosynthesis